MIERSRVRVPAGPAGEFSSLGSTYCADQEGSVSVPSPCHRSSTCKIPLIRPDVEVACYSWTHMHPTNVALNEVTL